jgi:hypothetical protein
MREHYNISLPLAIVLSLGGTLTCGRHFKIDLQDLARHNVIEHDASLTHANASPEGRYAPVAVDKALLQHLLDVSRDSEILTFDDLVSSAQPAMQRSPNLSAGFTVSSLEEKLR